MTLKGTPYIYQGDEIGMTNVSHDRIDAYDDVETRNAWAAAEAAGKDMDQFLKAVHWQSRDNARTPLQWSDAKNAGFSQHTPWIPVNENYAQINVDAAEKDPNSILHYYRKIIALRKAHPTLIYGEYKDLLPADPHLYCYKRWDQEAAFLVIHNFSDSPKNWKLTEENHSLIQSNYSEVLATQLSPWESRIYSLD